MAKTLHHIFFLKKSKNYVKGPVPIYLRITIFGKRAEISINKKVDPRKWLSNPGRMKGNEENARKFNLDLLSIEGKLYNAYDAIKNDGTLSAGALKNKYTGAEDKQRMLIPIFQNHNYNLAALVPKDYSPGTLERYKTSLSHTIQFLRWKYESSDIDIRFINHEFITGYDFFLRTVRKCANNTAVK